MNRKAFYRPKIKFQTADYASLASANKNFDDPDLVNKFLFNR